MLECFVFLRPLGLRLAFNYKDLGVQAGEMAAEILSGTPIKDIPVQYADKLQLSINKEAAKATGSRIVAMSFCEPRSC